MKAEIKSSEHRAGKGQLWEQSFGFALTLKFKIDLVLSLSATWKCFCSETL